MSGAAPGHLFVQGVAMPMEQPGRYAPMVRLLIGPAGAVLSLDQAGDLLLALSRAITEANDTVRRCEAAPDLAGRQTEGRA